MLRGPPASNSLHKDSAWNCSGEAQSACLVEEDSAVGLEGLPLQAGPEDDERSHRPIYVEA